MLIAKQSTNYEGWLDLQLIDLIETTGYILYTLKCTSY